MNWLQFSKRKQIRLVSAEVMQCFNTYILYLMYIYVYLQCKMLVFFFHVLNFMLLLVLNAAPTDLSLVSKGLTSITVKWQHPSSQQGQLLGYQLKYKKHDSSKYDNLEVDHWESQAEITGLERNTVYKIHIVGVYAVQGVGPSSEEIIVQTKTGT